MVTISPYALALGGSAGLIAVFAAKAWREHDEPGSAALNVLLGAVILWTGGYAVALLVHQEQLRFALEQVVWVGKVTVPVAWVIFVAQYTGHGEWVTRRTVALVSLPSVVMLAFVWTGTTHELVWTSPQVIQRADLALISQGYGPAFWLYMTYVYALVLVGVVLMLRLVFTAEHLFADQALAILVGVLTPLAANALTLTELAPVDGLDLAPYAFVVSGISFGYALNYSELLELVPATRRIGRTAVVRNMRDGVVVIDDANQVIDVNQVAEAQFDWEKGDVVGESLQTAFEGQTFDLPAEEGTVVWSASGPLEYEVKVSQLTDQHGRQIGRVLVVRDITDRTNRRQQLQVLNRVLRHNFRNDMNVIDVCSTQLVDRLSGENAELADRIRMVARDLTETGMKAREVERIMSRRHNDPQPIDLPSLVLRLVDTVQHEYPSVTVETDLPDALEIRSTGILESVLQNVLENAVIHNDRDEPEIHVSVEWYPTVEEVEISVSDNGPGIPKQEREVLVKGTETPLEHGSGLGLWLANWGVSMLGGEITFEDNEPRGSVVSVTFPRQQPEVSDDESHRDADQRAPDAR